MQSSIARLVCLVLLATVVDAHAQSSFDDLPIPPDTRVRGYWVDPLTGLMWAGKDNFGRDLNWRKADKYCRGLQLAGYADWRLPEIHELQGIHDPGATAQGLAGPHNSDPQPFHVKGDLFLTGNAWSASGFIDARGRFRAWGLHYNFHSGNRSMEPLSFNSFKRALCVRGDVIVDLSIPTRYFGVDDVAARDVDYLKARMKCEVAVFTGVRERVAEPTCRRLVELANRLPGDPVLERVNALGFHAVSLVSEGRLTESLTLLHRALALRRQRYEDDPTAADLEVIAAQVQFRTGNAAAGIALIESAMATYEKEVARPSSAQEQHRQRLAAIRKRFPDVKPAFSVFQGCVRTSLECDA